MYSKDRNATIVRSPDSASDVVASRPVDTATGSADFTSPRLLVAFGLLSLSYIVDDLLMQLLAYRNHRTLYKHLEDDRTSSVNRLLQDPAASFAVPVFAGLHHVRCLRTKAHRGLYPANSAVLIVIESNLKLELMFPQPKRKQVDVLPDIVGDFSSRWIPILFFIPCDDWLHSDYESMIVERVDDGLGVDISWNWCGYNCVESCFEPHVAPHELSTPETKSKARGTQQCI